MGRTHFGYRRLKHIRMCHVCRHRVKDTFFTGNGITEAIKRSKLCDGKHPFGADATGANIDEQPPET